MDLIEFTNDEYYCELDCFDVAKDMYEITSYGKVRNKITKNIISQFPNNGYYSVNLRMKNGNKRPYSVHRLVAETFCPKLIDEYNIVHHKNTIKNSNHYRNLQWCTTKQNVHYAIIDGSFKVVGEDNATAILTNNQVHEICKYMEQGIQYSKILENIGIEPTQNMLDILTKIRVKHIWVHISNQYNIPDKEYRTKQHEYSDAVIHLICRMIQEGKNVRSISEYLNIDISNKKNIDKFTHFIRRIKIRETYTEISCNYNW